MEGGRIFLVECALEARFNENIIMLWVKFFFWRKDNVLFFFCIFENIVFIKQRVTCQGNLDVFLVYQFVLIFFEFDYTFFWFIYE